MRLPNDFESYLKNGIIRKITPDEPRAKSLLNEAKVSLEGLKERVKLMGINKKNANSVIKDCYDIIMETIRAKLLLKGHKASGFGAHEAEVSYLKKLNFPETEISFLNELREFRNAINYRGKILDEGYAQKVYNFLEKNISKLQNAQ